MRLSFCPYTNVKLVFWLSLLFQLTLDHLISSKQLHLCHDDERSALLQFKESLTISETFSFNPSAYPKVESWKVEEGNDDCCSWDGIKCNEDTGHVIRLDLTSSYLYGSINSKSSLFHLVHLEWLSLADNDFNFSKIPSAIKNLSRLTHLDLSYSGFSGQIQSEILELRKLVLLNVSYNYALEVKYEGLRSLAEMLSELKVLDLSGLSISSSIPHNLANLTSLTYLSLENCRLQDEFPTKIFQLPNIYFLNVHNNRNLTVYLPEFEKNNPLEELILSTTNLSGGIPNSIGNLKYLSYLDISDCNLQGTVPSSLANLTHLNHLDLSYNQLAGQIPFEIGKLSHLISLNLGSNRLEGPIPSSIFELKNLQELNLDSNNLNGTLNLDMFLKLKSLEVLVISSNSLSLLTENIFYTNLQNFYVVGLGSCNLSVIPNFLQKQEHLEYLDLSSNRIHGQVPRWLLSVGVSSLAYLNLSCNLLTGFEQHPNALPWNLLHTLDLRSNKFEGQLSIPPSVTMFSYLVSKNQLTGAIPLQICSLLGLHALDLSYNNLSGKLPPCLGNFSFDLAVLKLQHNKFHGSIPEHYREVSNLRMIDLSNNLLNGRIPRTLASCKRLEFINLGSNQINDTFPSWLGTLPKLKVLILRMNKFHGDIKEPKTDARFPELRIIDLSHNKFTGTLPSKYFQDWNAMKVVNASQLTYMQDDLLQFGYSFYTDHAPFAFSLTLSNKGIDMEYRKLSNLVTGIILSNNDFGGEIPMLIGNLKGLHNLNISNNHLQGGIPSSLANLTVLESLDLSNNNLAGEIPQNLAELTSLEYFNVSHNLLTGLIPEGKQFDTFENSSFDGNLGLCGKLLSKKCKMSEASQTGDQGTSSPFAFGWQVVVIGYASGLIIGVVLGHFFTTRKRECFAKTFGWQWKRI